MTEAKKPEDKSAAILAKWDEIKAENPNANNDTVSMMAAQALGDVTMAEVQDAARARTGQDSESAQKSASENKTPPPKEPPAEA